MCENCFLEQTYRFDSSQEFETFDLILTQKLGSEKIKLTKDSTNERGAFVGYFIYKCKSCSTHWYLSIPENAWRGFFLTEEHAKIQIKKILKEDQKKNWGCLTVLLLTIFLLVYLWIIR